MNKKEFAFEWGNEPFSIKPNTIAIENLPFPIVLYPTFGFPFFAFKKNDQTNPYFCSCTRKAIVNCIKIGILSPIPKNADTDRVFLLNRMKFPQFILQKLKEKKLTLENILSTIDFKNKLCHECNKQTPSYLCGGAEMKGTFKRNYGWYVKKQSYEYGIHPFNHSKLILKGECPDDILAIIEDSNFLIVKKELLNLNKEISEHTSKLNKTDFNLLYDKREDLLKISNKYWEQIQNVVENEVRRKFGHKKIGESWTNETILYNIIKKLFPQYTVYFHYKPKFLQGMELDIFIEEIKLGIEYQGIQHYKPIKHWGGKESFEKLKERDKKKKEICKLKKVKLIYFNYNEGLSNDIVLEKLKL